MSLPWRGPDQVHQLKEHMMQQSQQRRLQSQDSTARARVLAIQLRSGLRKLDINNNRIFDIHYFYRNVVALLSTEPITYIIYNQAIRHEASFAYLVVPFKPGDYLGPNELFRRNSSKAVATMNLLTSIGFNLSGFSRLLSIRFYAHIVRSQLEYGLAINRFTSTQLKALENVQNRCICKICDARGKAFTKVMLHLAKLPLMTERVHIFQAHLLFRSPHLPNNGLLCRLLPHIRHTRRHRWYLLSKAPLWRSMASTDEELDKRMLKAAKKIDITSFYQAAVDLYL
ncbi:hypothetical protein BCV72DRAFT_337682 [Rhizopus microsporus var. microsporus]|uniref:Uncharacterized protein n=2 Tax=Rhizopus microsporus TaxID=58291 RepID=A0A2G4SRQ2_RHIZD|nr:uncharacterized protein RHIMIDRAFT_292999 [Rhizopus microsporus ATCC 52813]ORE03879.1 hypothetical protein BCV72DRAFT_337682 [Rhizopus microsporus var. microsporus]PHZ11459.1 hypothetical protein RHIMIDRAFT_292999 [Rhizopus microsporus ATCC 52813]